MDDKFSCGCLWTKHGDISTFKFCPIHAAAPDLFEAVKIALLGYRNLVEFGQLPKSDADTQMLISTLEAALELAGDSDETVRMQN